MNIFSIIHHELCQKSTIITWYWDGNGSGKLGPFHVFMTYFINSYLPGQDGRRFTNNIFRRIFMNEKFCILIKISLKMLKFVSKDPIDNNSALV